MDNSKERLNTWHQIENEIMNWEWEKRQKRFRRKKVQQKNEMKRNTKYDRMASFTILHVIDLKLVFCACRTREKYLTDYRVHSMILDNDLARHELDASPFTANDYISLQNFATWLTLTCKTQPKWNKNEKSLVNHSNIILTPPNIGNYINVVQKK